MVCACGCQCGGVTRCVRQAELAQTAEEAALLDRQPAADGDSGRSDSAAALQAQLADARRQLDTVKSKHHCCTCTQLLFSTE